MSETIADLPPTIAVLPFFVGGRFPKPDLLGRCEGDAIVRISGRELVERVREIGLGLQRLGLAPGDRVLLLAESRPEWLLVDFAILASGGVTVPVYPTLAAEQVGFIARDSGATIAIVSTAIQLEKAIAAAPTLPDLRAIVVTDAGHGAGRARHDRLVAGPHPARHRRTRPRGDSRRMGRGTRVPRSRQARPARRTSRPSSTRPARRASRRA